MAAKVDGRLIACIRVAEYCLERLSDTVSGAHQNSSLVDPAFNQCCAQ
jgi:hypothetical protein